MKQCYIMQVRLVAYWMSHLWVLSALQLSSEDEGAHPNMADEQGWTDWQHMYNLTSLFSAPENIPSIA